MLREVWERDDAQNLPEYALILTIVLAASVAAMAQIATLFLGGMSGAAGAIAHR